jgi:hypothetical protein
MHSSGLEISREDYFRVLETGYFGGICNVLVEICLAHHAYHHHPVPFSAQ